MPVLNLGGIDNLSVIIRQFHTIVKPFPLENESATEEPPIPQSYLRTLFNITNMESADEAAKKLSNANNKQRPAKLTELLNAFYVVMEIDIQPLAQIEDELRLCQFLLHYLLQKLTGTSPTKDSRTVNQIKEFMDAIALSATFQKILDAGQMEKFNKLHNAILDLAFQNAAQIALEQESAATQKQTQLERALAEIRTLQESNRISLARSQNGAGSESSEGANTAPTTGLKETRSSAGLFNLGGVAIHGTDALNKKTRTQILSWLRYQYPEDARGYKDKAVEFSCLCRNLKMTIDSLKNRFLDEYTKISEGGDPDKAERQLDKLWTKIWDGRDHSSEGSLSDMINRLFVTATYDPRTDTSPVLAPEPMVVKILTRAIGMVNTMLNTMVLPRTIDANSWCIFLYAYRSMLFALLRPIAPELVRQDDIGAKVSQLKRQIFSSHAALDSAVAATSSALSRESEEDWPTAKWIYMRDPGEFLVMIREFSDRYYTSELAHRTVDNVPLEKPACVLKDAIETIIAGQTALPIDEAYKNAGLIK